MIPGTKCQNINALDFLVIKLAPPIGRAGIQPVPWVHTGVRRQRRLGAGGTKVLAWLSERPIACY